MSPLDDELRTLLHGRAARVRPAPDPLAGVERRAGRIRRRRRATAVATGMAVLAALAVGVPALVTGQQRPAVLVPADPAGPDGPDAPDERPPSAAPTQPAAGPALDPQRPWDYRGDRSLAAGATLERVVTAWRDRHPGARVTPLYGHVYEPSGQPELAFVSRGPDGDRWGVAAAGPGAVQVLADKPLPRGTTALLAALPGDEGPRLLVLAAPGTGDILYAADGRAFAPIGAGLPGVGTVPLGGDTSADVVRVLDGDGDLDHPVFEGPAPDFTGSRTAPPVESPPAEVSSAPALAAGLAFDPAAPWAYRGAAPDGTGDIVSADRKAYVTAYGEEAALQDTVLYAAHLSATTDVAVVLHRGRGADRVSFTANSRGVTQQRAYEPARGEDILSAYLPLDPRRGLLVAVASDRAGNLVLQTGDRAEAGGSRTAGIWDWAPGADPQARLAAFAAGDAEPYASQPAT